MNELAAFLEHIRVGEAQTYKHVTIYALHSKNGHERAYQTLDESLASKSLSVEEISEGGNVPQLKVVNTGGLPVLLIVGEELIGAKQNRVLNTSLLIPAGSEMPIPVSCVEQGRWSYRSRHFSTAATASHSQLRRMQVENVTNSLREKKARREADTSAEDLQRTELNWYDSDQRAVWGEVQRKMAAHGSHSQTAALHDAYTQNEDQLVSYLNAFTAPQAEGFLVAINGTIVGADVFDHHETLKTLWSKLLRSYLFDALEQPEKETIPLPPHQVRAFLHDLATVETSPFESVGMGKDVRIMGDTVSGSGLLWEDRLIHASVFNRTGG
ncbi:MAG TPA: hypothetical protein PLD47_16490 [Aggregatilineales bacterium]|nr:hypothetical protein [Anaerolineales bacterium]HRE49325.1 hypothetical protein [Aggregatilineales bacterium]